MKKNNLFFIFIFLSCHPHLFLLLDLKKNNVYEFKLYYDEFVLIYFPFFYISRIFFSLYFLTNWFANETQLRVGFNVLKTGLDRLVRPIGP